MLDALTPGDADGAFALSRSFGWLHRRDDWALLASFADGVVWRRDGELLGTAMLFPFGPDHASIGGVMVAASLQGQGIGRRLMGAAMDRADRRNLRLHATPAGVALYASLGFRPDGTVHQWQGTTERRGAPPPPGSLAEIAALDAAGTGLQRASMLERFATRSELFATEEAYAMRRPFGRGTVIGPIVARREAEAVRLAEGLLTPGFHRLDIAATAGELARSLEAAGLRMVDTAQVMVRGDWPAAPDHVAIASQATG